MHIRRVIHSGAPRARPCSPTLRWPALPLKQTLGWVARDIGRAAAPTLFKRMDPGTAGTTAFQWLYGWDTKRPQEEIRAILGRLLFQGDQALKPVSQVSSVTDVINKVTSGQADAGVVYVTDALAAGDKVASVNFAESSVAVNTYQIAVLKDAPNPDLATKFVDLVTGDYGQRALKKAGFAKP